MTTPDLGPIFLDSVRKRFESLKRVAEGAIAQVSDTDLAWALNPECNSIRIQIQHLHGNMVSRWTDPLTTDGEKPARERDAEFIARGTVTRADLMAKWEEGWSVLMGALASFTAADLTRTLYIRSEAHTLVDAINRQLMHVAYHVGQIVHLAKERTGERWQNLSIARGKSKDFTPAAGNTWSTR